MTTLTDRRHVPLGAPVCVLACLVLSACAVSRSIAGGAAPTPDAIATQQAINARVYAEWTAKPRTATPTRTVTPTPTSTETPTATPTSEPTPEPTATVCVYNAAFVVDLTVSDGTVVQPDEQFYKGWRIRNSGNCPWLPGFSVVCIDDTHAEPVRYTLTETMPPGVEVDIQVPLEAPRQAGTYRSNWRMQDDRGRYFGATFYAEVVVQGEPTPPPTALPTAPPQRPDVWCAEMEAYMRYLEEGHRQRLARLLEAGDVAGITRENSRYQNEMAYVRALYNINCGQ